ncbi:hypothetical protein R1flu_016568 [Riccia fluitans]|uniref:Uncharacterized protein n=1 Tax=Riccia fluitans TaxID=41844 RepID=A0ABD1YR35_9MARC
MVLRSVGPTEQTGQCRTSLRLPVTRMTLTLTKSSWPRGRLDPAGSRRSGVSDRSTTFGYRSYCLTLKSEFSVDSTRTFPGISTGEKRCYWISDTQPLGALMTF